MERVGHAVIVGCLVRNDSGRMLLIRHYRRGWEIPQGHVEAGEDVIQALQREVMEETGLVVNVGPLASVWSKLSSPPAIILNFLATSYEGVPTPSEESPELGWFSEEEAKEMMEHPANRDRLVSLLQYEGDTLFHAYSTSPYRVVRSAQ